MKESYANGEWVKVVAASSRYFMQEGVIEGRAPALGFYYVRLTTGQYKGGRARFFASELDPTT